MSHRAESVGDEGRGMGDGRLLRSGKKMGGRLGQRRKRKTVCYISVQVSREEVGHVTVQVSRERQVM